MQTSLINLVGKGTTIDGEVHRLSLAQTIYFHAVFRLETLRQQNPSASFLPCFAYITDPGERRVGKGAGANGGAGK